MAPTPGLAYVGLRWLTRRSSGLLHGFPTDAAAATQVIASHLERRCRDDGVG